MKAVLPVNERFSLSDLLQGLQQAVLSAQTVAEQQHQRQLDRYFEEDGTPLLRVIKVPETHPDATSRWRNIEIPLISLAVPTFTKLTEMTVRFQASIVGYGTVEKGDGTAEKTDLLLMSSAVAPPEALSFDFQVTFTGTDSDALANAQIHITPLQPLAEDAYQLTAWVDETKPKRFTQVTIHARLTQHGRGVSGANVYCLVSYKSVDQRWPEGETVIITNKDGEAQIPFHIGRPTPHRAVVVTIFAQLGDRFFQAGTSFTPQS